MSKTKIDWTDCTWNPTTGCTKISAGCANCYAEIMAKRCKLMGLIKYRNGFDLTLHPDMLNKKLSYRDPKMIFVNSMSDMFHKDIPLEFIDEVFMYMRRAPQHIFQALTKRGDRLEELSPHLFWHDNIWMGVTVENEQALGRIDNLRTTPAIVRFVSIEPLLGPLPDLNLEGIHWVIVGGESGPKARPMDLDWVRPIRDKCINLNIPFFFKQKGGFRKQEGYNVLDGQVWHQFPENHIKK